MADEIIDLLKIKIEKAKRELPLETVNAVDAVDWRATILGLRSKYGYTFEQLGDLELETELLLCGLVGGGDYPKELGDRMKLSKEATNTLVNDMNNLVFRRIQEELIKNIERKKIFQSREKGEEKNANDNKILSSAGIEIVPEKLELTTTEKPLENRDAMLKKIEKPEIKTIDPILSQKLSGSVQIGMVKTEHSLENITKSANTDSGIVKSPKIDPYREIPE